MMKKLKVRTHFQNAKWAFLIALVLVLNFLQWNRSNDPYSFTSPSPPSEKKLSVEDLMYEFKSDKSRDDHGYSKLYDLIFSPIQHSVRNVTEIGIAAGQSLQAWHRLFPMAEIHGFDVKIYPKVQANLDKLKPRVHTHIVNVLEPSTDPYTLGFLPESMDIIIEDGPHSIESQEDFLFVLFDLLKPGGIYVIEDVGYMQGGVKSIHEDPSLLKEGTRKILENNDAIWVDSSLGHRAWGEWVRRTGRSWAQDHVRHNSYSVVIKKRERPLRPVQMNYNRGAMDPEHIVIENGTRF